MALFRVIFPPRSSPLLPIARTRWSLGGGDTKKKINVPRRLICGSVTRYRWPASPFYSGYYLLYGYIYIWFFNPLFPLFFLFFVLFRRSSATLEQKKKKKITSCIISVSNPGVSLLPQTYTYQRPNKIKQLLRAP